MDVVTSCLVVFQVLFFILHVPLDHANGQPLYENPREHLLKAPEAYSNYQKIYERELFQEKKLKSLQKELEITRDACKTSDLRSTSLPNEIPSQNISRGSKGKGFIVLFMKNIVNTTKTIYVTSEKDFKMNITTSSRLDPILKSQIDRNIVVTSSHHIILPTELDLNYFKKEVKSVLIETSEDVNVISFDNGHGTVGSTMNLPKDKLSTKYIVISAALNNGTSSKSQLAVAAVENNTTISITFKMDKNVALKIEGNTFYRGDMFSFSLDCFETYQISHSTDLTGTVIESSLPIAAFSGNDCTQLDNIGYCDHLIAQLPPTNYVDNAYIVPPNFVGRDTIIRITAIEKSQIYYKIGSVNKTVLLYKSNVFDTRISSDQASFIESTRPVLVTGIGLTSKISNLGDPTMTIVQGIKQYLNYYKVVIPTGYVNNFVSLIIKESSQDFIRINSSVITACNIVFEENVLVSSNTYNVKSVQVPEGELTAFTLNGEVFGMVFTGVKKHEAYGFSGNILLP